MTPKVLFGHLPENVFEPNVLGIGYPQIGDRFANCQRNFPVVYHEAGGTVPDGGFPTAFDEPPETRVLAGVEGAVAESAVLPLVVAGIVLAGFVGTHMTPFDFLPDLFAYQSHGMTSTR